MEKRESNGEERKQERMTREMATPVGQVCVCGPPIGWRLLLGIKNR